MKFEELRQELAEQVNTMVIRASKNASSRNILDEIAALDAFYQKIRAARSMEELSFLSEEWRIALNKAHPQFSALQSAIVDEIAQLIEEQQTNTNTNTNTSAGYKSEIQQVQAEQAEQACRALIAELQTLKEQATGAESMEDLEQIEQALDSFYPPRQNGIINKVLGFFMT
jgi:hypothetical protein